MVVSMVASSPMTMAAAATEAKNDPHEWSPCEGWHAPNPHAKPPCHKSSPIHRTGWSVAVDVAEPACPTCYLALQKAMQYCMTWLALGATKKCNTPVSHLQGHFEPEVR